MRRICIVAPTVVAVVGMAILVAADREYKVQEKEDIRKVLSFGAAPGERELVLDNVFGSIDVEGDNGDGVRLAARKTIRARNADRLQKAKEEVRLEITEEEGSVDIYVDGPFRCQEREGRLGISSRDLGYIVLFDFVLKVPRRTNIILKTVSEGDIVVRGVEGHFDVRHVNGKIRLEGLDASGEARTVNGGIKAFFRRNPDADSFFKTINGNLEVEFLEGLSADFIIKTFNGEAYTDFEVVAGKPVPGEVRKSGPGGFIYKKERGVSVRVAGGGPRITLDTFNGDIYIKKKSG